MRLTETEDFKLIVTGFPVQKYLEELEEAPELWDSRSFRKVPRYGGELSPHRESNDIWVRHQHYEALGEYDIEAGRESIMKPTVSEWYPESQKLPAAPTNKTLTTWLCCPVRTKETWVPLPKLLQLVTTTSQLESRLLRALSGKV